MVNFIQQSGRGGRNGQRSDSIIIDNITRTGARTATEVIESYAVEAIDEAALTLYIQTHNCRRQVIGDYMDGEGTECASYYAAACNNCQQQTPTQTTAAAIPMATMRRRVQEEAIVDNGLHWTLRYLRERCIYCVLVDDADDDVALAHTYASCPQVLTESVMSYASFRRWRRQLRFAAFSSCYRCGLSQSVCTRAGSAEECE